MSKGDGGWWGGEGEVGARVGDFLVENDASYAGLSFASSESHLVAPLQPYLQSLRLSSLVLSLLCLVSFPVKLPFLWSKVAPSVSLASTACGKVSRSLVKNGRLH